MTKAAIVILAGDDTHADMGYVTNALSTARQFQEAGDDVEILFDGAGTEWIPALNDPDHPLSDLYQAVRGEVAGACAFCAKAFEVKDQVQHAGVELVDEADGHPNLRDLVADGYQVLTF